MQLQEELDNLSFALHAFYKDVSWYFPYLTGLDANLLQIKLFRCTSIDTKIATTHRIKRYAYFYERNLRCHVTDNSPPPPKLRCRLGRAFSHN
jgi:hypothetical protein